MSHELKTPFTSTKGYAQLWQMMAKDIVNTNAIKYWPNNNTVEVTEFKGRKKDVAVSVKDPGIEINKEEHKKYLNVFTVWGESQQSFPGFRTGLFIFRSIIDKHTGRF